MASDFKIGTTSGGLTSLDALTTACPDPQPRFDNYRKKDRLGDMSMKGRGPQTILWNFPMLEVEQIAQLESFLSADPIYIRSRKRDDTFGVFEVYMNFLDAREDGEHMNGFRGFRANFPVEFIVLSEVV